MITTYVDSKMCSFICRNNMEPDKPARNPIQEAIDILLTMKRNITDDANLTWTAYDSPQEIRAEPDTYVEGIRALDHKFISSLGVYFYPTSDFQNLAIDNGWGDEYLGWPNVTTVSMKNLKNCRLS